MSHTAVRPAPPPSAAPWIRPTTAAGSVSSAANISAMRVASATLSACEYDTIRAIHSASAPALKTLPAPLSTTTRRAAS